MVILTTFGLILGIQVTPSFFPFFFFLGAPSLLTRPEISDEQREFFRPILGFPLEQRKCRDLITLDTLHLYCGGPEPTAEARKLEEFSRQRKWTLHLIRQLIYSVCFTDTCQFVLHRDGSC